MRRAPGVLALTFMHGSRRRLSERLRTVANLASHVECCTLDAYARRIYRRWRGLAAALVIAPTTQDEFDDLCDAAGLLLEQPDVRAWVAASFPIVLVDEGQDLKPQRLRMLGALSDAVHILIASDEFQGLDQALRPNPPVAWLNQAAEPEILVQVHRTDAAGRLTAATAIRARNAPVTGNGFKILPPGASVQLAATLLANAIAWRQGGNVAVFTPPLQGDIVRSVVTRVAQGPCGSKKNGPYIIHREGNDRDEAQAIVADLDLPAAASSLPAYRCKNVSGGRLHRRMDIIILDSKK